MKHTLMAAMFAVAALSLGAADGLFKKACPVWLSEPEAIGDAQTVPFGKWIGLDETDTTLRIASDRPVRINFEWKLVGWIPGDGMAHDFPIIGGKGMHELRLVCDAKAKWLVAEVWRANGEVIVFTGDPKTKGGLTMNSWFSKQVPSKDDPSKMVSKGVPPAEVEATVSGLAEGFAPKTSLLPFKHKGDRHWLYHVVRGKDATFVSGVRARGIPSASIRCNQPGVLVVKWGGKPGESARVEAKKEGGCSFFVNAPQVFDKLVFTAESGEFELSDVGCTTLIDFDIGCSSLATSDAKINADFADARMMNDRSRVDALFRKALGLKSLDREAKVVTIDPTVRNGLTFCGAKIGVGFDEDAVLDIRWKRDGGEGMATDSSKLPDGWKLVRDFDMQAECQRLIDSAVADQLSPGVQFCAYKDGKCIVNVFAGKLTKAPDSPSVQVDSLFPIFSTEKPLLSTACHRAVERGLMDYDKPLCTWWPELDERGFFAKLFDLDSDTKKERLTLRETLGYRTSMPGGAPGGRGNPVCDHMLSDRELCDWDFVCKVAAADRPNGVPGTVQAYLPYAYAWMIGHPLEVAMGKPLNDVLTEEVLIPSGIEKEFYFVVPRSEYPRVAEYYDGGFCENMNHDWARQALLPSAWGVSSAQALCKFYNRLCGFDGKEPLIKKETLDAALKPCRHPSDPLPNAKSMKRDWFMLFGMGYGLWGSAERMDRVFGHGGAGGSEALVDRDHKLIVGYTCNSCKNSIVLRDKLYEVVGMRWRYWNDNVNIQDLQMSTSGGGNYGAGITSQP